MNNAVPQAFMAGAPGPLELLIVFLAALLVFGPRRLPEIARSIGKAVSHLRRASQEFKDHLMNIEDELDEYDPSVSGEDSANDEEGEPS